MFNKKIDKTEVKQLINRIIIFKGLQNHTGLIEFLLNLKEITIKKDSILYHEGDIAKEVFILLNGTVEVKRKSISGDNFVVAIISASKEEYKYGLVGERALCAKSTRSGTITSMSDLQGLRITKTSFDKLCKQYPDIGLNVYKVMCDIIQERLYLANRNVVELFNAYVDEITAKEEINYYSSIVNNFSNIESEYV